MTSRPILVILLHGIRACGAQLRPLAGGWSNGLRTARFASPDAPFHSACGGRKWFNVDGTELLPDRIHSIRQAFDDVIHEIVQREGFGGDLDRVAFVGVSQGAIMALDAVASGRWPIGVLVSFSGLLAPVPITATSHQTAILLLHGQEDRTIPAVASTMAASRLRTAGFKVDLSIFPAVGHTISAEGAALALGFLRKALA